MRFPDELWAMILVRKTRIDLQLELAYLYGRHKRCGQRHVNGRHSWHLHGNPIGRWYWYCWDLVAMCVVHDQRVEPAPEEKRGVRKYVTATGDIGTGYCPHYYDV